MALVDQCDDWGTQMPSTPDRNRQNALAFYDLMFNQCQPREAIDRYAGQTYTQHNPHVADGKDALTRARSSSTGTCCRSCPPTPSTPTGCS